MGKHKFDENEAFDLLRQTVKCRTVNPPGNEVVLARQLQSFLKENKIDAKVDEFAPGRANLVFRLKGETASPALLLTGHLDTVPVGEMKWRHEPFACESENGLVYGRGIADMKSSVAAMLYALILLRREGLTPEQDVVFLATADEEVSRRGAAAFVKSGGMSDIGAVLVGEPSNSDILLAHKGAMWLKVTARGKTAHGSMPHLGVNAVNGMAKFIHILNAQSFACLPNPLLGSPTFSVNSIQGGVAVNVVPDSCVCTIDIRTIPGQTEKDIRDFVDAALAKAAAGDADFCAQYEFLTSALPVEGVKEHHIVQALEAAAGKTLIKRGVNYYTDASTLLDGKILPLAIYGPGDDKQAHQPDEHIILEKYFTAIEVYKNFVSAFKI
ncbi:MAG: M20 family metallopeptidase [Acidaminococcales bacterium]|jgi:succinyl-diaminopimelate desuccinylase|nr:M20 family metallopeptidase [Acidaminococcales bacterium]